MHGANFELALQIIPISHTWTCCDMFIVSILECTNCVMTSFVLGNLTVPSAINKQSIIKRSLFNVVFESDKTQHVESQLLKYSFQDEYLWNLFHYFILEAFYYMSPWIKGVQVWIKTNTWISRAHVTTAGYPYSSCNYSLCRRHNLNRSSDSLRQGCDMESSSLSWLLIDKICRKESNYVYCLSVYAFISWVVKQNENKCKIKKNKKTHHKPQDRNFLRTYILSYSTNT